LIGFVWLRIRRTSGRLWIRSWTFGLHKRWGISWLAEWLLVSQEELFSRSQSASYGCTSPWLPPDDRLVWTSLLNKLFLPRCICYARRLCIECTVR
jgi:hypothetical protein